MTPAQRKNFTFVIVALGMAIFYTAWKYVLSLAARDQVEIEQRIPATPSPSPFVTSSPQYVPPAPGQDKG